MPAPTRRQLHAGSAEYTATLYAPDTDWDVSLEDRAGPPLANRRRKLLMRGGLAVLLAGASCWVLLDEKADWPGWLVAQATSLVPALERARGSSKRDDTAAGADQGARMQPLDGPLAPGADRATTAALEPNASAEPTASVGPSPAEPAETDDGQAPGPLPPLPVPTDPLQKRALAVGLHPGLSRVVLTKLSAAGFDNAGIAIRRAIAETPDDGSFTWPAQHKSDQAQFKVHFVAGAVTLDCRRYVVSIAMDGWLTTALPMEKCGVQSPQARGN